MKEVKPETFEFICGNISWSEYIHLCLIPSIVIVIDRQAKEDYDDIEDYVNTKENTVYKGHTSYILALEWISFYFRITLNILTK